MNVPAAADDARPSLSEILLPGLTQAGFDEATTRVLAQDTALLRSTLAKVQARMPAPTGLEAGEDPTEPGCPMFTAPVSPLRLEPEDWMDFIYERNRRGARSCEVVGAADYARQAVFRVRPQREPTRLLLLETANGLRPMAGLEATAERLLPGWMGMTTPRAVFETLRLLWDQLNELNAAYVMVAPGKTPQGVPIPIIFNPPQGGVRLGFVNQVPRNSGYTGYLVFCGEAADSPS